MSAARYKPIITRQVALIQALGYDPQDVVRDSLNADGFDLVVRSNGTASAFGDFVQTEHVDWKDEETRRLALRAILGDRDSQARLAA